jgi:hypothetical protein
VPHGFREYGPLIFAHEIANGDSQGVRDFMPRHELPLERADFHLTDGRARKSGLGRDFFKGKAKFFPSLPHIKLFFHFISVSIPIIKAEFLFVKPHFEKRDEKPQDGRTPGRPKPPQSRNGPGRPMNGPKAQNDVTTAP